SFDLITLRQALEHIHDPLSLLREVHRLLAPAGKLIVSVPNIDSWPFRWFGANWFGLDLPRHLTHFTPRTLRLMAERAGFWALKLDRAGHGKWTRVSAETACAEPAAPLWQRLLALRPVARLAAEIAVWLRRSDCLVLVAEKAANVEPDCH